jgi:hypothetical protein
LMMSQRFHLVGGKTTPLKNDGVRPLGWCHSHIVWKVIKVMFQTTKQNSKDEVKPIVSWDGYVFQTTNQITIIFPLLLVYKFIPY